MLTLLPILELHPETQVRINIKREKEREKEREREREIIHKSFHLESEKKKKNPKRPNLSNSVQSQSSPVPIVS